MPEHRLVEELMVNGRVYALSIGDGEEATEDHISHWDMLGGVSVRLHDDFNFLRMDNDEAINLVNDILPELSAQILESILLVRDELIVADEIVTLAERYENGEQDWEL